MKEYIKPLTHVINKSFESGKFPNLLNIAKIFPILNQAINQWYLITALY